jgi:hypothetical protein
VEITFVNMLKDVEDREIQKIIRAVNRQIADDFAPHYFLSGRLTLHGSIGRPVLRDGDGGEKMRYSELRGDAILYLIDSDEDDAVEGAVGWHFMNHRMTPFSFIYRNIVKDTGDSLSGTISHEALEMLANPHCNLFHDGPAPPDATGVDGVVYYNREVCDAVSFESYEIDGVTVSDFVLPPWWTWGEERPGRTSFCGAKNYEGKPLRSFELTPRGFQPYFDPGTKEYSNVYGSGLAKKVYDIKKKGKHRRRNAMVRLKLEEQRRLKETQNES